MKFLPFGGGNLDLNLAVFHVKLGGNDRQSFFARLGPQLVNLRTVQQQFTLARRRMVHDVAVGVLADVRVQQPHLVIVDFGVAFFQLDFSAFGRFDLSTGQHNARFIAIQQKEVVSG